MYTQFYELHSKPFQISSDPAFMWFGEKHKEALATLQYGILDNKGFLLLTGDVGTGKTSLINTLLQRLRQDVICASVPDPSLEKLDLFNYIAAAFGMDREFKSKGSFLGHFRNFLVQANVNNKKVLLIIDEAQLLTQEMLEEIRLLSNIEKTDTKLINIFFIGQNEFNEILSRPQNRAVNQRMTLNYNLNPLTPDETDAYIRHRLKVAGTEEQLFDQGAVQEIFLYSGGFPRRINILCDHSLLSGFVKEQRLIDASIVSECARELKIPSYVRNRDANGFSRPQTPPPSRPAKTPVSPQPPPRQPGPYPNPASPPAPPENRFPWTGVLVFASVLLLIWVFMFPDHFRTTVSMIRQRAGQNLAVLMGTPVPRGPDSPEKVISPPMSAPPIQNPPAVSNQDPGDENWDRINTLPADKPAVPAVQPSPPHPVPEPENTIGSETIIVEKKISLPGLPKTLSKIQMPNPDQASKPPDRAENSPKDESPPPIPVLEATNSIDTIAPVQSAIPPLPKEKVVIRFRYDTNDFTEKGVEKLENFAKALAVHPEARIVITGHTDSQGSGRYNLKLSEFRANIVNSYLMGKGINSNQMTVQGLGDKKPIEKNDTTWGRMMNRRVEIQVLALPFQN